MWTIAQDRRDATDRSHIRQIRVAPFLQSNAAIGGSRLSDSRHGRPRAERWDLAVPPLKLADASLRVPRPKVSETSQPVLSSDIAFAPLAPDVGIAPKQQGPLATAPESRPEPASNDHIASFTQTQPLPLSPAEVDASDSKSKTPISVAESADADQKAARAIALHNDLALGNDRRLRPDRIPPNEPNPVGRRFTVDGQPKPNGRDTAKPPGSAVASSRNGQGEEIPSPRAGMLAGGEPIPLARATPDPG